MINELKITLAFRASIYEQIKRIANKSNISIDQLLIEVGSSSSIDYYNNPPVEQIEQWKIHLHSWIVEEETFKRIIRLAQKNNYAIESHLVVNFFSAFGIEPEPTFIVKDSKNI